MENKALPLGRLAEILKQNSSIVETAENTDSAKLLASKDILLNLENAVRSIRVQDTPAKKQALIDLSAIEPLKATGSVLDFADEKLNAAMARDSARVHGRLTGGSVPVQSNEITARDAKRLKTRCVMLKKEIAGVSHNPRKPLVAQLAT